MLNFLHFFAIGKNPGFSGAAGHLVFSKVCVNKSFFGETKKLPLRRLGEHFQMRQTINAAIVRKKREREGNAKRGTQCCRMTPFTQS